MGKAKRAHQFHETGQCQSFEDGRQINKKIGKPPALPVDSQSLTIPGFVKVKVA